MGLVQSAQNQGTGTTLTVTLSSNTTANNGLIVAVMAAGSTTNPTSVSMTLGGAAGNFAQRVSAAAASAFIAAWDDLLCTGGQTAVAITATGGSGTIGIQAAVYEFDNLLAQTAFDKSSTNASTTAWTSNATATTAQAIEVAVGLVSLDNFSTGAFGTITGPASPWVNLSQQNLTVGSAGYIWMSGYEILGTTQAVTYSGTVAGAEDEGTALVATFKAVPTGRPGSGMRQKVAVHAFIAGPAGAGSSF
jgi:hypothetical protein